jgi:hypothetical protein
MAKCGYPGDVLSPTKGQHAPTEAYVEYAGKVPAGDQQQLIQRLNAALKIAIAAGGVVVAGVHSYDEAARLCGGSLPPYIKQESRPRVVVIEGIFCLFFIYLFVFFANAHSNLPIGAPGCPCGGTHVADVSQVTSYGGRMTLVCSPPQSRLGPSL